MDDGQVKGTRFATFKYDAAFFDSETYDPPAPTDEAYYPPLGTALTAGDTYKAVAMVLDEVTGNIYITGEGPRSPGASDQDYKVIAYDKDLSPLWGGAAGSYNGPAGGDDIPADIAIDWCQRAAVVVTGTSPGVGTGLDIATVAFLTSNGNKASALWSPDGVRRYNNDLEDGDDRAAAVGNVCTAEDEQSNPILEAVVFGTSWGGTTTEDDYTYHKWVGASTTPVFDKRYNNGGNDVGVAMSPFAEYVTGYSEGGSGIDIATLHYDPASGTEFWANPARYNYTGGDDFPLDLHHFNPPTSINQLWITGCGMNGSNADVLTLHYDPADGSLVWDGAWLTSADYQYGKAMTVYGGEPYITGSQGGVAADSGSPFDRMLAIAYEEDLPDYIEHWYRTWNGPYIDDISNEGRGIAVAVVQGGSSERSIYIVGVSTESGEGRQFTVWRYKEE